MMAISGQKTRIFAEGGLIADSNPRMDEDGIQMLPLGKRGINRHIVHIFKILREMKDFERCSLSCEKFMDEYRQELARIKMLSFDEMDISDCADFLKHSYSLTQRLAYDRFKYALFPTMLMFDKYTRVIQKVDKSYSAFDFYWGLDNQTAVFGRDVAALAERIRRNPELSAAVAGGERFRELCSGFEEFRLLSDEFMKAHGFKSDYNCYCLEAQNFIENPDRLVHILRPLLSVQEGEETECGEKASAGERVRESAEERQRARGSAEAREGAEESARGNAEARESAGERTKERAGEKSRDFDELMSQLRLIYKRRYRILERRIACFRYFHVVREETQYMWETLFFFVRKCVERVNRLLLDSDDYRTGVANLFYEELLEAMARGYLNESDMEKIARRNDNFPISQKVWEASKLLVFDARGALLRGVSGSAGVAVGKACIIRSPQEFYKMQRGDVLVCQLTDPEWTPLFKLASAVVADTGAALSHAAIVAREFNIPAVLGVGFATTRFKDGDMLQVDGDRGMVRGLAYEYKS